MIHLVVAVLLGLASAGPLSARPVLVGATAMPGAPAGAAAYAIRYRSTDVAGRPAEMSGVVIVPAGTAPPAGRDVVVWTHGTSGIADQCAPSRNSWLFGSIAGLETLLDRGYVVVAPDYEGLGSAGPHPYLVGPSAARAVVGAVRAAREMAKAAAGPRFVVWGESQGGHAALWSGRLAGALAPELQLVGVAAAAPPTDLVANLSGNSNAGVRALLTAYTAASWHESFGIPLATIARPVGADLILRLAANCVTLDGFKLRTKIGLMRLIGQLRGVDLAAVPAWGARLRANSVPAERLPAPVLIAQGDKDVIVAPAVTRTFGRQLCAAGQQLRFIAIAGGDHISLAKTTAGATIDWIGDRFAGKPAPSDCPSL